MTPKELLYIDDVLSHSQQMRDSLTDFSSRLQDRDLQQFVKGLADSQSTGFQRFYSLLNG